MPCISITHGEIRLRGVKHCTVFSVHILRGVTLSDSLKEIVAWDRIRKRIRISAGPRIIMRIGAGGSMNIRQLRGYLTERGISIVKWHHF